MSKNIQKLITFTEEGWEKVLLIQSKHNLLTPAEAVRYAITETIQDPAYLEVAKLRLARQSRPPEEKMKEKINTEEVKAKIKADRIAEELAERIEIGKRYATLLDAKAKKDSEGKIKYEWRRGYYVNPKNASIIYACKYPEDITEQDLSDQFTDSDDKPIFKEVFVDALKNCGEKW